MHKLLLTARQFEKLAPDLGASELERGEVVRLFPGGLDHGGISGNIAGILHAWARRTKRGRIFTNESGLITENDPDTVRGVDVIYYSYRRLPRGKRPHGFSRVPPELAVAIIGKGQGWKKMVQKASEYLQMGVDRVWIVDPGKAILYVFRADQEPLVLRGADRVTDSRILPGFSCPLRTFFVD